MKTYNITARPGGHLTHEVPRYDVTPAEIALLRAIHGADGVVKVRESGSTDITLSALRNKLEAAYGPDKVAEAFGKFGSLPSELPEPEVGPDDEEDDPVPVNTAKRKTLSIKDAA